MTTGKPLRGRQILHKDYKNIIDFNNVTLRGDDVLGFIIKWDVLMRVVQAKLPSDEQNLVFLERQIVNSTSFNIKYALLHQEKDDSPGSNKATYDYLHTQIHNHTRRYRANEIAKEYRESPRQRAAANTNGEKPLLAPAAT